MPAYDVESTRRSYTATQFAEAVLRHRSWGRWGADDELGAGNYVTPDTIRHAAGLVRSGRAFSLAIPLDRFGPQPAGRVRVNPQHVMLRHGGDILADWDLAKDDVRSTDDAIYMPLQSGAQWDAFCHIFHEGKTYNGRGPETVTSDGALYNSITTMKDRAVGRGVLLDIPRYLGVDWLEPRHAIQDTELEGCAAAQGVDILPGDFLLVRTGHMHRRQLAGEWGDFVAGPAPGLGLSAGDFLCPRGVTAVATDTWGLEVQPGETDGVRHPLHVCLLVNAGVYIGEMWDLEALADACAEDESYEFLLVAAPLTVTGAVGSPLNPIAIK